MAVGVKRAPADDVRPARESTVVLSSTSVEMLCRLYAAAHATTGDFEQVPSSAADSVPADDDDLRELLLRYFGADYCLGMSLICTAVERGWQTEQQLIDGVASLTPRALACELLASTTLEARDQVATTRLVDQGLGAAPDLDSITRRIARRNAYRRADVERALSASALVQAELLVLLRSCVNSSEGEQALGKRLTGLADYVVDVVAAHGRESALLSVTGGWTVRNGDEPVVLLPTEALGSLVIPRLLPDGRMLVAFGPSRDRNQPLQTADIANIARALSSEQRLAILRSIGQEPASGQTLAHALGLTGATVHYHTSLLRSLGLITSVRDAHSVVHSLADERLLAALTAIGDSVLGDQAVTFGRRS